MQHSFDTSGYDAECNTCGKRAPELHGYTEARAWARRHAYNNPGHQSFFGATISEAWYREPVTNA